MRSRNLVIEENILQFRRSIFPGFLGVLHLVLESVEIVLLSLGHSVEVLEMDDGTGNQIHAIVGCYKRKTDTVEGCRHDAVGSGRHSQFSFRLFPFL